MFLFFRKLALSTAHNIRKKSRRKSDARSIPAMLHNSVQFISELTLQKLWIVFEDWRRISILRFEEYATKKRFWGLLVKLAVAVVIFLWVQVPTFFFNYAWGCVVLTCHVICKRSKHARNFLIHTSVLFAIGWYFTSQF